VDSVLRHVIYATDTFVKGFFAEKGKNGRNCSECMQFYEERKESKIKVRENYRNQSAGSSFGVESRKGTNFSQHFGKLCSCHLQGG
jgi:hypothetical protein